MVIEAGEENAVPWMAPVDAGELLVIRLGVTSKLHHPGGTNGCFVDGSVRFLKTSIPESVRRGLMTISGSDDPSADQY
jgi:prepilin-type processing-associated H-X9-DG protein